MKAKKIVSILVALLSVCVKANAIPKITQVNLSPAPLSSSYAFRSSPFLLVYQTGSSTWASWDGVNTSNLQGEIPATGISGVGPGGHVYFVQYQYSSPQGEALTAGGRKPRDSALRTCKLLVYDPTVEQTKILEEDSSENCYIEDVAMSSNGGAVYTIETTDSGTRGKARRVSTLAGLKLSVDVSEDLSNSTGNSSSIYADRAGNVVLLQQEVTTGRRLQFTEFSSLGAISKTKELTIDSTYKNCRIADVLNGGIYGLECYRDVEGLTSYRYYTFNPNTLFFEQRDFLASGNQAPVRESTDYSHDFDCAFPARTLNYADKIAIIPNGEFLIGMRPPKKDFYFATISQTEYEKSKFLKKNFCLESNNFSFTTVGQCSRNYSKASGSFMEGGKRRVRPHGNSCAVRITAKRKRDISRLSGARVEGIGRTSIERTFSKSGSVQLPLSAVDDCQFSITVPSKNRSLRPIYFSIGCPTSSDSPSNDPTPVPTPSRPS